MRIGLVIAGVAALSFLFSYRHQNASLFFPRDPSDFSSQRNLGRIVEQVQRELEKDPENIQALIRMGITHYQMGKEHYLDALNELEHARELGAVDPRIFYYLGVMYQEVGLYSYAIPELERFLRNFPED